MFATSDGKIGTREYFSIIAFCIALKATNTTPTMLCQVGKNAAWVLPLISCAVTTVSFSMLLILLKRYENKGLMDIIHHLMGKYIGFFIGIMFFSSITMLIAINGRSYVDIMGTLFYINTPKIVLFLILIFTSYFIANRGFEAIGRTGWIVFPYIIIIVFLFILLVWRQVTVYYLFPIAGPGIKELLKGGLLESSTLSEVILLSVFFPLVRGFKEFKIASFIGIAYSTLVLSLFCAVYIMVFDYPPVVIINYPFQTLSRLIYFGRFISNLEAFFLIFWVISSLIRFATYLYMDAAYFALSLNLEDFEPLILPISALTIIIGMMPENFLQTLMIRKFLLYTNWIIVYPLPVLLLIISQWKGDYKK